MSWKIRSLSGREILDSRGRPTVKAYCEIEGGMRASASVPSGASTGASEAHELRDGDPQRYRGAGCRKAAAGISDEIHNHFRGRTIAGQQQIDVELIELDGTENKARLGANALLAVSIAFARALAAIERIPLYRYFASMAERPIKTLPRMTINLFSGGLHAGRQVPIQDVLIVPASAGSIDEGLGTAHSVYMAAVDLLAERYGVRWLTADEGGLAPPVSSAEEMLGLAVEAIGRAGLVPGKDVCIAVDVASSHFYRSGRYYLDPEQGSNSWPSIRGLPSREMIRRIEEWICRYPIVSVEDGLAEEDWEGWPHLCETVGVKVIVLGDDLLCTNPKRIRKAAEIGACNGLLLKVNQIGTLTEALEALRSAREAGWNVTLSVRSGETEDDWFSDLAVGWSADQTKVGSITQSERLSKYNRLLEIEEELHLPMVDWPSSTKCCT